MVGAQQPKPVRDSMYGTTIPVDTPSKASLESVSDRLQREIVLDAILDTRDALTPAEISDHTAVPQAVVEAHLDALTTAGIATRAGDSYTASWGDLPLDGLVDSGNSAEVFLLEARDKEYREWFGVDDPYEASRPSTADSETAIVALDQWFGVRKRLHQLADTQ